jgi:hypothetical protein
MKKGAINYTCVLILGAALIVGCRQAEKKVPEAPAPPTASVERVVNPWSPSSDPSASYRSLGHPAGVINPWVRPSEVISPAELPLPEAFSGIPRAAALSTLRQADSPSGPTP